MCIEMCKEFWVKLNYYYTIILLLLYYLLTLLLILLLILLLMYRTNGINYEQTFICIFSLKNILP